MRTSIATVCLSGTLEDKLHACAEAGFAGVEIFEQDLLVSPHSPEQIRDLAARLGITLDLYQPIRDIEGVEPEEFARNLRRLEGVFARMGRLGIRMALLCSNVDTATIDDDEVVVAQLRQIGDLAARYGVKVAYEALAWGRFVNDFAHVNRLVVTADHPNIGQCLDSFHIFSRGGDITALRDVPADKIFFVQLADAPRLDFDVISWSRHYRVFPGQGDFALAEFLGRVAQTGYDGPVSLEIFNDTFRQADPFGTAVDGMRSLVWLQDEARRWSHADGEPEPRMPLAALPATPRPDEVTFAEVRSDDAHLLRDLLERLGFANQGVHRSKPVELWAAGGARIVVNDEAGMTGRPTIAALGFDVAEPVHAVSRAVALRAESVPRTQQQGEEVLQAVRAPDAMEVFFGAGEGRGVPAWAAEFGDGTPPADPHLITSIDHVNLAQHWQHFDEAVLFYKGVLGLQPQPSLDVAAPVGLVRSQSLRTEDGGVRLALNLVPAHAGPDPDAVIHPQHIAFACSDVIALADQARARGLEFLAIPANYYDDLAVRFDLDDSFLADLRRLDLLYDRDEHGEFLHFYTPAVGAVFLEVVERRGSYEGYGAPNAPVRLAVQHRLRREHP